MCHRPAASSFTRKDLAAATGRDQRKRTQPTLGIITSPTRRDARRTFQTLPNPPETQKPSSRPAFLQAGFLLLPEKKRCMATTKSRMASC